MREFIYYLAKGRTSGNFKDLMEAGRLDIACHVVIAAFFLSHKIREDVRLHLILNGPPDPPKHIEFEYDKDIPFSKKDIGGLLKRILYKYKKGEKNKVFPGCYIEKKSFVKLIEGFHGRNIYLLDKKGEDIRDIEMGKDPIFILGDQEGIERKDKKFILKNLNVKPVNIGSLEYFSSQVVAIVNNELDRKL